jgi:hypothetical protein
MNVSYSPSSSCYSSLDDMKEQSNKDDNLVPIRLEFEADGYKLRDTFTWNLNGKNKTT